MSSGRKPKPTRVKEIQGNPGKRKLNGDEPKPTLPVKRPRGLAREPRKVWDEVAPDLERVGVMTGWDTFALRLLAEHYALAIEAVTVVREEGLTVDGRDGPKKHPAATVFKENAVAALRVMTEFGMTPSSRSRLHLPEGGEQMSLFEEINALMESAAERSGVQTEAGAAATAG